MITIDGAYGEGGGQILRTSASLAAITGRAVRVVNVRAGRAQPGLKAQHLTAIQAAMRVCNGRLEGGAVGSTEVTMEPGSPVQPGRYAFDVGTAGSATLVLQTLLVPLLLAGESHVSVTGGTHALNAPSSDYLVHTFLPASGLPAEVSVERVGFFPKGGGTVVADLRPSSPAPIRLVERGERAELTATVTVSEGLPEHVLERAGAEIERLARTDGWPLKSVFVRGVSPSPGMAVHLDAAYSNGRGGFTALGARGKPTERVVEDAWADLTAFDATDATADEHLADQLILPALFADGPSAWCTARVTEHLRTMAWLVPQFGVGRVTVDEADGRVAVG